MSLFDKIVESKIREAIENGELDEESNVPEEYRAKAIRKLSGRDGD